MKCDKCGNEDLHVVSEYVELPEKKEYGLIKFLICLITLCFVIGAFFLFMTLSDSKQFDTPFFQTFGVVPTFIVLGLGVYFSILLSIIKIFQPYEHTTRLRVVCLKCGESWRIPVKDVKEQTKTEETKTESN